MIDDLYDLVLSDNGFLSKLRCQNEFDEQIYLNIKSMLQHLVDEWKTTESIPPKALLIIIELIDFLSGGSKFLNEKDKIKVEDANLEIKDIIYSLYI